MPILDKMADTKEEARLKYIRETFASQSRACGVCKGGTELIKSSKGWHWRCKKNPPCFDGFKSVKRELKAAMYADLIRPEKLDDAA